MVKIVGRKFIVTDVTPVDEAMGIRMDEVGTIISVVVSFPNGKELYLGAFKEGNMLISSYQIQLID